MGAFLQLMSLPASCMAFTWARRCGAAAVANALLHLLATIALRDVARMPLDRPAERSVTRKSDKGARASGAKTSRPAGRARSPRRPWKTAESVGFA
jgi:hypothetical protein